MIYIETDQLEVQELVEKLRQAGLGRLVGCLLDDDAKPLTRNGRINKSRICRSLKINSRELDGMLSCAQEVLAKEYANG